MRFRNLSQAKNGISTIAAIFMLLLMFAALTVLLVAFFNYNLSAKDKMDIEQQRAQEKIELTTLAVNDEFKIINVVINNTGTIDVRIRAVYKVTNGETTFLFDPSTYTDTQIAPTASLIIYFPADIPEISFDPQAKIVAATERGIKTLDYVPTLAYGPIKPPSQYDPTKLYIGPLMLKFDDFSCHITDAEGNLDPNESWQLGWIVAPSKGNTGYAWKISVMNIDDRNITINRFTSFNLVPTEAPSTTASWYLNPAIPTSDTQFLGINQTASVTFIWKLPLSGDARKLTAPSGTTCSVFLTFFGVFHEVDGTETPYAQTIPFEAAVTVT